MPDRRAAPGLLVLLLAICSPAGPADFRWSFPFAAPSPAAAGPAPVASFDGDVKPMLVAFCYDCHGEGSAKGEVSFDTASADVLRRDRELWTRVWENVRNGTMPPRGKPRPTQEALDRLGAWISSDVHGVDCRAPDPGRVTLRRLNRDEYNHSVADLFGIEARPADEFPPDDSGHGFDNVGSVLAVSPLLAEKYFDAAERVVRQVVAERPDIPRRLVQRQDLELVAEPAERITVSEARFTLEHAGPHAIDLKVSVNSFRPFFGKAAVRVELDGHELLAASYVAGNRVYRRARRLRLARGEHVVRFTLDLRQAEANAGRTINIGLEELEVTGPLGTGLKEYPPAHRRLFFSGPAPRDPARRQAYARAILASVAGRAFRAPADPQTLDRLVALATEAERQNGRFESGIAHALQAILTSPGFLFRPEAPAVAETGASSGSRFEMLDDHALASRLSYLFLASGPDDELGELARQGRLRASLRAQVERLLRDPRSDRFVGRFVGQWLQIRDIETVPVAGGNGRLLTPPLRRLMRAETERLFSHVMREGRDLMELFTADYSFLNGTLARYYGIPGVDGPQLRQVALPAAARRGGILTHGSVLTVTSNPDRTSPVKRGVFVLDNLLGAPPPPPPPNVPTLEAAASGAKKPLTVREQLAIHREKPACGGCHARMDPLGLALESYDSVGRWRDEAEGAPVDSSATLPGGERISGAQGLRDLLVSRREQVYRAFTRRLMIFALGRGLQPADECTVDRLVADLLSTGGRLSTLLAGLVESPPFLQRGTAPLAAGGGPS